MSLSRMATATAGHGPLLHGTLAAMDNYQLATLVHLPTPETRDRVARMAAIGLTTEQMAHVLNCSPSEITLHYESEVLHGLAIVTEQMATALIATGLSGDVQAQKYWLEVRAKWKAPPTAISLGALSGDERRALLDSILGVVTVQGSEVLKPQLVPAQLPTPDRAQ